VPLGKARNGISLSGSIGSAGGTGSLTRRPQMSLHFSWQLKINEQNYKTLHSALTVNICP